MNNTLNENHNIEPDRLTRMLEELNTLYEVSSAMHTTLDLDHILYIILTSVTSHTGLGYNRALLFLVTPDGKHLEFKMGIGPESGEHANQIWGDIKRSKQDLFDLIEVSNVKQTLEQSSLHRSMKDFRVTLSLDNPPLLAQAYFRGKPWHLPPTEIGRYGNDPLFRLFQTHEMLIVPLIAKNKIIGLIAADNIFTRKPINEDDIRVFTLLTNQAALAIENSRLHELVLHKSHTDPVTDLWNHGYFQEKLAEELKKADRNGLPLTLVIIDIDNFKNLNDTYGHQHGDMILKEMAAVFLRSSRAKDFVCRYGGEEFSIILGETSKEQGCEIAERLRTHIEQHPFPGMSPGERITVTISVGLATFPQDATSKEELIALADKAMYIAKFSGKNKTCANEHPPQSN